MKAFTRLDGLAAPLGLANIDTDQIIPKQFLKTVDREGLARGLFYDFRFDEQGAPKDGFVLNDPAYRNAQILIAGDNFGCGSSREHAPQAIHKAGFRALIAENFAEIFFGNSTTLGIPCVTAAREDIAKIAAFVEANPQGEVVIDLIKLEARFGGHSVKIAQRESARDALVNGRWDAIGELLDGIPSVKATATTLPYLAA
jgi:3-isopropylmalate/(R)-2-methylmalate dehydratase small subunit